MSGKIACWPIRLHYALQLIKIMCLMVTCEKSRITDEAYTYSKYKIPIPSNSTVISIWYKQW